MKILVSAGEASGEMYAAVLVERLRERMPEAEFFGCAGPQMRRAGVRAVVDAATLSVVGLVEVVAHIPRIYWEFRKLLRAAQIERPDLAILTDSPDFHLRLAARLKRQGVPVIYLVAPQVWAWRKGRISGIRRNVDRLLCIFPFEEKFFRDNQVSAEYIGHPLSRMVRPRLGRAEFLERNGLSVGCPIIALLPGSRAGERARHWPVLAEAAGRIRTSRGANFIVAIPAGARFDLPAPDYVRVVEGETWDVLAHADIAIAASGTVTVEAALLGTPMVTFYRVNTVSWWLGRLLVSVPFYSMVNLVAGRAVVPELMQNQASGERLAAEAMRLLDDTDARDRIRANLRDVAIRLETGKDPLERAADIVEQFLDNKARLESRLRPGEAAPLV